MKSHNILWDRSPLTEQGRACKTALWNDIFKLFENKYTPEVVRNRWRYMCMNYRRLAKLHNMPHWKYYEAMSFIPIFANFVVNVFDETIEVSQQQLH